MNNHSIVRQSAPVTRRAFFLAASLFIALFALTTPAQSGNARRNPTSAPRTDATVSPSPALTRTTVRRETRRLGYGGALTVTGAPVGSITIEAWPRSEVEVVASIEMRADTEEDLARLAAVNNFVLNAEANHLRLVTTGTHDRRFMRRAARDFPRRLLSAPWKIDYRIRVPALVDLEIFAGRGALDLRGTEGATLINASESDVTLTLAGGSVSATVGRGTVRFIAAARSWRGQGAEIRLAAGDLIVELPANFNADLTATIAQAGRIENTYPTLAPRDENTSIQPTERTLAARAGAGGATLAFTVGAGTLRIRPASNE